MLYMYKSSQRESRWSALVSEVSARAKSELCDPASEVHPVSNTRFASFWAQPLESLVRVGAAKAWKEKGAVATEPSEKVL